MVIPDPAYLMAISDAPLKDDKDKFLKYFASVPLGLAMLATIYHLLYFCPLVIGGEKNQKKKPPKNHTHNRQFAGAGKTYYGSVITLAMLNKVPG